MKRPNPKHHFEPRKKKPVYVPQKSMRLVRIDARTEILVSADISDEDARQRYYNRINRNNPVANAVRKVQEEIKEEIDEMKDEDVSLGSLEEMETAIAGMEEGE